MAARRGAARSEREADEAEAENLGRDEPDEPVDADEPDEPDGADEPAPAETGDGAPQGDLDLSAAVGEAMEQLAQLLGRQAEGVTGVRREGDGWSVLVDVMELERIPASSSVMATYRVDLDSAGHLDGYERLRRYSRGATDPR